MHSVRATSELHKTEFSYRKVLLSWRRLMTTVHDESTSARNKNEEKLYALKSQFDNGFSLARDHIMTLSYLEMVGENDKCDSFSHDGLESAISTLSDHFRLELDKSKTEILIQKLIQIGVLKNTISLKSRYHLTRLGRNITKSLLEEADYRPEAFNSLLLAGLSTIKGARVAGIDELKKTFRFTFFDVIQEKIEAKIARIDEDLEYRKQQARDAYTGSGGIDYGKTVADLKHCQQTLGELVETTSRSSTLEDLELELEDCGQAYNDHDLREMINRAQQFLSDFRDRIATMLADLVSFVRDCSARHSLALSVTARERLWRVQEKILAYALDHPLQMPHIPVPQIPRWRLPERQNKEIPPVVFTEEQVKAVRQAPTGIDPSIEQQWKKRLIQTAKKSWGKHAARGGVELIEWLDELAIEVPEALQHIEVTLFFLMKEWSKWKPGIVAQAVDEQWAAWKGCWHLKSIFLKPAKQHQEQSLLLAKAM